MIRAKLASSVRQPVIVRKLAVLAVMLWLILPFTNAQAAKKLAFVVGIDRYEHLAETDQLENAVNDAEAVRDKLKTLGYAVQFGKDLTRDAFYDLWYETLDMIDDEKDTLVVFFAGHGVELEGKNYLVPRNARHREGGRPGLLASLSISLNLLLDDLSRGRDRIHPDVSVVILDACRDNPFISKGRRGLVGRQGGLAKAPETAGVFVMYAAASQTVSYDRLPNDEGVQNSLYTRTLLPLLGRTDLTVQQLGTKVKDQVWALAEKAGFRQLPTTYDGIIGEFCIPGCEALTAQQINPANEHRLRQRADEQEVSAEKKETITASNLTPDSNQALSRSDDMGAQSLANPGIFHAVPASSCTTENPLINCLWRE